MINRIPIMPVIVMQFLPLIILPPATLFSLGGLLAVVGLILVFAGLGYALLKHRLWALNLSIFLQGFNIIVRVMMLFPNARLDSGAYDVAYIVASLLAIILSVLFLQRLDKPDFQALVAS
jgi:hypothetical protein